MFDRKLGHVTAHVEVWLWAVAVRVAGVGRGGVGKCLVEEIRGPAKVPCVTRDSLNGVMCRKKVVSAEREDGAKPRQKGLTKLQWPRLAEGTTPKSVRQRFPEALASVMLGG